MGTAIDYLGTLNRNPYIFGPLFECFYFHLKEKEKNLLLSYLVLPLILTPKTMGKLKYANKNSTLHTLFSDRELLSGLQERVEDYKKSTNSCLFLTFKFDSLRLHDNFLVSFNEYNIDSSALHKDQMRATKNLAILLNDYQVVDCFRILGIKEL
ncbi:hypothetical protein KDD30_07195 [Photobacterium sp. GJ3]|uniref:three component ABC system middle component n=1 Tax=Photobacterium sp. GJ3 TaxID=2829502 RepID=UPI001B8D21CA|nr:three component ABC system middle component [Photobacterium sp. GJ3]QUJ68861.1 hypothetical protein KDD30_07195 [Photobacterium sp. GJ3]